MKDDQGFWNFIFSLFFLTVFSGAFWTLSIFEKVPYEIAIFDFVLIILAVFRLSRLFVYDKITQFIRDWFLRKEVFVGDAGEVTVIRQDFASGPLRTIHDLLSCPWCFGVWSGLVVTFAYFMTPLAWFPILVLAVSGVGTFLQLFSNMVGWRAEQLKQKVVGRD
ncbi:MAG: DUF1360 domain-containing protein [Candidatus Paceibacterota bacterium]